MTNETPILLKKEKADIALNNFEQINTLPEEVFWKENFNSGQTIKTYENAIKQFIQFLGVNSFKELRTTKHGHVIAFKKHLISLGRSNRTVNTYLSAISSLFQHLIEQQVVTKNPALGVKRMVDEYNKVKSKCLMQDEASKLIRSPEGDSLKAKRNRAILSIFFYTGCRISELSNIAVKDYYHEEKHRIIDFKNKGGKRKQVAINKMCEIAIDEYLEAAGHKEDKDGFLIRPIHNTWRSDGNKISRKTLDQIWRKHTKMVGLEGYTPHSARTTMITEALKNGCRIETVKKTAGHSMTRTTEMYDKRAEEIADSASYAVYF